MRRKLIALAATAAAAGGGIAAISALQPHGNPGPPPQACHPGLTNGAMAACAVKPAVRPKTAAPPAQPQPLIADFSNNDPIGAFSQLALRRAQFAGEIDKVNQGNYVDPFYAGMVADARRAGLKVGGYDFVDTRQVGPYAETDNFVRRLRATGTCRGPGVIPPTLDVEYGQPSRGYIAVAVQRVRAACGGVQIYTGDWWWRPHLGCYWPAGVPGWISGYPNLIRPCGIGSNLRLHQFTDRYRIPAVYCHGGTCSFDASVFFGSPAQFDAYTSATPAPEANAAAALGASSARLRVPPPLPPPHPPPNEVGALQLQDRRQVHAPSPAVMRARPEPPRKARLMRRFYWVVGTGGFSVGLRPLIRREHSQEFRVVIGFYPDGT